MILQSNRFLPIGIVIIICASAIPHLVFSWLLYSKINKNRALEMSLDWIRWLIGMNLLICIFTFYMTFRANLEISATSVTERLATVQVTCQWVFGIFSGTLLLLIYFLMKIIAKSPINDEEHVVTTSYDSYS